MLKVREDFPIYVLRKRNILYRKLHGIWGKFQLLASPDAVEVMDDPKRIECQDLKAGKQIERHNCEEVFRG